MTPTLNNAKSTDKRQCKCSTRCKGGRLVSARTYSVHAKYRIQDRDHDVDDVFRRYGHIPPETAIRSNKRRKLHRSDSDEGIATGIEPNGEENALMAYMDPPSLADTSINDNESHELGDHNDGPRPLLGDASDLDPNPGHDSLDNPDNHGQDYDSINDFLIEVTLPKLQLSQEIIKNIQNATLEDDIIDEDLLHLLRNPANTTIDMTPLMRLSINIFIALSDVRKA
ncbi:hypothetical protein AMATHDRAFT_48745 [Amanita thiersii Skay4041]|uniref:Uncharacterized protein n=1 Tax=Amanita thiersii Skay4041 TaxID=703135 RepID=A0A2A9NME0_9AGAR|nr:hypothetical protein AMATHDRAFT_48745 [Amanita thiersii Skay4041]